jgi:hypothetical protein
LFFPAPVNLSGLICNPGKRFFFIISSYSIPLEKFKNDRKENKKEIVAIEIIILKKFQFKLL